MSIGKHVIQFINLCIGNTSIKKRLVDEQINIEPIKDIKKKKSNFDTDIILQELFEKSEDVINYFLTKPIQEAKDELFKLVGEDKDKKAEVEKYFEKGDLNMLENLKIDNFIDQLFDQNEQKQKEAEINECTENLWSKIVLFKMAIYSYEFSNYYKYKEFYKFTENHNEILKTNQQILMLDEEYKESLDKDPPIEKIELILGKFTDLIRKKTDDIKKTKQNINSQRPDPSDGQENETSTTSSPKTKKEKQSTSSGQAKSTSNESSSQKRESSAAPPSNNDEIQASPTGSNETGPTFHSAPSNSKHKGDIPPLPEESAPFTSITPKKEKKPLFGSKNKPKK